MLSCPLPTILASPEYHELVKYRIAAIPGRCPYILSYSDISCLSYLDTIELCNVVRHGEQSYHSCNVRCKEILHISATSCHLWSSDLSQIGHFTGNMPTCAGKGRKPMLVSILCQPSCSRLHDSAGELCTVILPSLSSGLKPTTAKSTSTL